MILTERSKLDKLGIATFSLLAFATAGLGTWQLKRYDWKVGLVENRKKMLSRDSVPITDRILDSDKRKDYEKFFCNGNYEYEKTVLVGPRSAPRSPTGRLITKEKSGFLVVTPFIENSSGVTLLVNRGWIPHNNRELALTTYGDAGGEGKFVELEAVVSSLESGSAFTPDQDSKTGTFFILDPKKICDALDLDFEKSVLVERINGPGPILCNSLDNMMHFSVEPATHLGYAATWYGFCVVGLFIMKKRFLL